MIGSRDANCSCCSSRVLLMCSAKAAMGQAFLLMGGDCAESFKEFHVDTVRTTRSGRCG